MSSGQQGGPQLPGVPVSTGGRLTEDEQKWVAKLLSDPTYFPIEFRTWLKNFLEQEGGSGGGSGGATGGGGVATGLRAGIILPCAMATIPPDCLPCDGTTRLRTEFPALFEAIGVTWGAGDSTTTFNLPDLRDRALFGAGGKVSLGGHDGVAFGSRGGPFHKHNLSGTAASGGTHSHSVSGATNNTGGHRHGVNAGSMFAYTGGNQNVPSTGSASYAVGNYDPLTGQAGDHQHTVSGSTSEHGGHTHSLSGDTSGGFQTDRVCFAGVVYAITTGA